MHPLEEWLIRNRISKKKFALRANIAIGSLYKILNGDLLSKGVAQKIEIATNKQVTLDSLSVENGLHIHYRRIPKADEKTKESGQ